MGKVFLGLDFFNREPAHVAHDLIGAILVLHGVGVKKARIVEAEAYLAEGDAAAHTARYGRTPAREALFMGPGTIYIHAMRAYVGMDIVTAGGSVLLRAAEPVEGFENPEAVHLNGPGKLCRGMDIDRALNGLNLCESTCPLRILPGEGVKIVKTAARIGISRNAEVPLRFYEETTP